MKRFIHTHNAALFFVTVLIIIPGVIIILKLLDSILPSPLNNLLALIGFVLVFMVPLLALVSKATSRKIIITPTHIQDYYGIFSESKNYPIREIAEITAVQSAPILDKTDKISRDTKSLILKSKEGRRLGEIEVNHLPPNLIQQIIKACPNSKVTIARFLTDTAKI